MVWDGISPEGTGATRSSRHNEKRLFDDKSLFYIRLVLHNVELPFLLYHEKEVKYPPFLRPVYLPFHAHIGTEFI